MISIIDYGSGNIRALSNILELEKIPFKVISARSELKESDKIILPGVGSFDHCINRLNESGLRDELEEQVINKKKPILGICIGLQIMAQSSQEGENHGLGWIDAEVIKFDKSQIKDVPKTPHMGWNNIKINSNAELFSNVNCEKGFYFIHSYHISLKDESNTMTTTDFGYEFVSGINHENIYAVQYHPEKSHNNGVQFLKNFCNL